ncbi:Cation-independent mannose-6-phosphate receptor CI-MPR [Podila horticola]|nr:Cation-independent mannose-6-phosphate receptor CI-MPR [Podila horticola]
MAMTEHTHGSYFQSTHTRVDSKFHSDTSCSEKIDESFFHSIPRPLGSNGGGGLRRCAGTRDLTSIGDNVNYCARISVEYMSGKPCFPFQQQSWQPLSTTSYSTEDVLVDNDPDRGLSSLETLDGEQEAMYMYALKDGDQIVLLVHETSTSPVIDPVAQWVESIRAQKEFLAAMYTTAKFLTLTVAALALAVGVLAAEESPDCTVTHNGKFYDLRPLIRESGDDWVPDTGNDDQIQYKLNVCHTVLYKELDVKNPDGVASWGKRGKGRSLGQLSKTPFFRSENLLLKYENGDECLGGTGELKRSTLIHFVCDNSVSGQGKPVLIADSNECSFWFEWRTPSACATDKPKSDNSGGVFGTILGVALFVYFAGGIAYNRIVHHARGLKQIPNYHSWVEAFDFIKDMAMILFAKCYRPKRSQTYHNLPVDSEINTLIDDDYEDDEV